MTFTLQATVRTETGKKVKTLRNAGSLPAVVYGPKQAPVALTITKQDFEKVFKDAGESSVITLTGLGAPVNVLVSDVAFDARRGGVIHVDFYAVETGKRVTVDVPLVYAGEAPALKLGGTLTKVLHEVTVEAEPTHLPKEITVDVSALVDFDSQIHVRDLSVPAGVTIKDNGDDVVALVQAVKEEKEAPALDMGAIEVEKKGKTDEASA